jgi:hypothetical protein
MASATYHTTHTTHHTHVACKKKGRLRWGYQSRRPPRGRLRARRSCWCAPTRPTWTWSPPARASRCQTPRTPVVCAHTRHTHTHTSGNNLSALAERGGHHQELPGLVCGTFCSDSGLRPFSALNVTAFPCFLVVLVLMAVDDAVMVMMRVRWKKGETKVLLSACGNVKAWGPPPGFGGMFLCAAVCANRTCYRRDQAQTIQGAYDCWLAA